MLKERIKERRKLINMTLDAVGERLGVTKGTVSRWETGDRSPEMDKLPILAQLFGTSVAYLIGETDNPEPITRLEGRMSSSWKATGNLSVTSRATEEDNVPQPLKPDQISLPIIDQEACAGKGFDYDDLESCAIDWMPWPTLELGGASSPRKPYFVRVQGDSMEGVGIDDGSLVLINPNVEVTSGDIVYAKWNGRCSIKGLIEYPDGRIELRPAKVNYKSIWVEDPESEDFCILGAVVRWVNSGIPKKII